MSKPDWRGWIADLLEPLWPLECPLCSRELCSPDVLRGGSGANDPPTMHPTCLARLEPTTPDAASPRRLRDGVPVRWCFRDGPDFFRLLHAAKYGRRPDLIQPVARAAARHALECGWIAAGSRIVPMPDDPDRLRARGASITGLIARELSACSGRPLATDLLRRRPGLDSLSKVEGAAERSRLVRGRFRTGNLPAIAVSTPLILVEDQVTTGSTAMEATRALGARGNPILLLSLAGAAAAPRELQH